MATVVLTNTSQSYSTPVAYPWINTVNGYYQQGDTFTSNSLSCHLFRNAAVASGSKSGIYLKGISPSQELASSTSATNLDYTYTPQNVSKIEVQFHDAFTSGGYTFQDIYLFPCPTITYSVPSGVVQPTSREVRAGNSLTAADLPSVTLSGHVFDGWYYENTYVNKANVGDVVNKDSDFTLYARFIPITDFSVVRYITIPEGPVLSIKDSNNVVLWKSAPLLMSITLAGYNTSLNINSNFLYGGTVTANYSDGSTADVTLNTTFTGYDMSTAGTQTVTASYTEHGITKTATYQLTIVSAGWHTIWEGSKTIRNNAGTISGTSNNFAYSETGTGYRPMLRLTFSNMTSSAKYYNNQDVSTTKPISPLTINEVIDVDNARILGVFNKYDSGIRTYGAYTYLTAARDGTNNRLIFSLGASTGYDGSWGYDVKFTLTKIEQYY